MKLFGRARAEPAPSPEPASSPVPSTPEGALDAAFLLDEPAFAQRLAEIDARLDLTPAAERPRLLAELPADLFALLCLHRPAQYPRLAAWLPAMPDAALQTNSTGAAGQRTMLEASRFVAAAVGRYRSLGGDPSQAKVLDFGVCWARISRLLYQHVSTENLYGVDAWAPNLDAARQCGFLGRLALIEEAPSALPFPDVRFDLAVAFSVFTHLSESSGAAAIRALRSGMADDGLLVVTLRPRAFADIVAPERRAPMGEGADSTGFGYFPEPWSAQGLYGDAVITPDYVRRHWTGFELVGLDVNAADPYQLYAFLRPR